MGVILTYRFVRNNIFCYKRDTIVNSSSTSTFELDITTMESVQMRRFTIHLLDEDYCVSMPFSFLTDAVHVQIDGAYRYAISLYLLACSIFKRDAYILLKKFGPPAEQVTASDGASHAVHSSSSAVSHHHIRTRFGFRNTKSCTDEICS